MLSISKKTIKRGLFIFLALAFYYLLLYLAKSPTSCFFKLTTGIPCPACGMSRAVFALTRGEFLLAWYWHPLVYLLPLVLVLLLVSIWDKPSKDFLIWRKIWLVLALVFIGIWIIRMLVYFPYTPPMDYYWGSLWGNLVKWIGSLF
ncbi:MAG: DUF2752 domain-containing protein [Clostridia bacterium]